ncbi:hypothetical protein BS50DRAFT_583023 [Corynespora cassiicola Philippines]|uniref:Uncharacterized protein n=1 Tax=Corynespora cassiicola Philippines TaxID=1448308 RepID=A0A2T2P729_CORCC|nr:hypothetical protein BS50DRAFT_583023 [Corynespora cassiicola Philippines]
MPPKKRKAEAAHKGTSPAQRAPQKKSKADGDQMKSNHTMHDNRPEASAPKLAAPQAGAAADTQTTQTPQRPGHTHQIPPSVRSNAQQQSVNTEDRQKLLQRMILRKALQELGITTSTTMVFDSSKIDDIAQQMWVISLEKPDVIGFISNYVCLWDSFKLRVLARMSQFPTWWWCREVVVSWVRHEQQKNQAIKLDDSYMEEKFSKNHDTVIEIHLNYDKHLRRMQQKDFGVDPNGIFRGQRPQPAEATAMSTSSSTNSQAIPRNRLPHTSILGNEPSMFGRIPHHNISAGAHNASIMPQTFSAMEKHSPLTNKASNTGLSDNDQLIPLAIANRRNTAVSEYPKSNGSVAHASSPMTQRSGPNVGLPASHLNSWPRSGSNQVNSATMLQDPQTQTKATNALPFISDSQLVNTQSSGLSLNSRPNDTYFGSPGSSESAQTKGLSSDDQSLYSNSHLNNQRFKSMNTNHDKLNQSDDSNSLYKVLAESYQNPHGTLNRNENSQSPQNSTFSAPLESPVELANLSEEDVAQLLASALSKPATGGTISYADHSDASNDPFIMGMLSHHN